jgi:peptidoglycan/LPS O-acetylase OafA/YrhL
MGILRLALAVAVLLSHLPPATFHFISGGVAVQGFFVISGFYMALLLSGKYRDIGLFYSNRLLRLFPAYFVVMAFAAVALFGFNASATASPAYFTTIFHHPGPALFFGFENLAMIGQELLFWFKTDTSGALTLDPTNAPPTDAAPVAWQLLLVPQSWSLSMELMFYALAPLLMRLRWQWLVGIAAASIALRYAGFLLPVDYGLWQGRLFPTALFLFLFGILAHRALPAVERIPRAIGYTLGAVALAVVLFEAQLGLPDEISRWVVYATIALTLPFVFNAFRNVAADRWIGELSYPLYLTHLNVVGVVLAFALPWPVVTSFVLTLAASIALLVLVDRPIDAWRQRRVTAALVHAIEAPA